MSQVAIKVENISKKYRILHKQKNSNDSLLSAFAGELKNMFKAEGGQTEEEFWALKDINFEINHGDRVGIIGRNGAGKSTLLKILSRIVKPSSGRIEYYGRMASLLEVGTGFHGDLTGRENIYLNGSILGMSKKEIDSQFDAIVAFSEVEQFLDTPVKRYSSGMYVRLAFAVAAHLNPEILIVDEVLAVGDSAFQKKCLGKMNEISRSQGKTILFVSHNLAAIQNLCNKAFVLNRGSIGYPLSDTSSCIKHYLSEVVNVSRTVISERSDRTGEGMFRFTDVIMRDNAGAVIHSAQCGMDITFEFHFAITKEQLTNFSMAMTVYTDEGKEMFTLSNAISGYSIDVLTGNNVLQCKIKKFPLADGSYICNLIAYKDGIIQDYIQEALLLNVEEGDFYGTGRALPQDHKECFLVENKWSLS
jgi:lipopolysaccharide transport system ATP-binding protein